MGERIRVPIPFGRGLDREVGVMVAPRASMEDLRNVLIHNGKYRLRRGFEPTLTLLDGTGAEMTSVLGGQALRSTRNAIYVGYNSANGKVEVFRGDSLGLAATHIATWFTQSAGALPPVVSLAESYGRVFIAHDHAIEGSRQKTVYYDSADDALHDYTADLGGGVENVKFRGVCRHLPYLWGTCFAGNGQGRQEVLRVSQPGDPLTLHPEHYFLVGDRNDPITRVIPMANTLAVFKETEAFEVFGYSRDTFGQRPLDPLFGLPFGRLAVNVGGLVFAWTNGGPRLYTGRPNSMGVHRPLELLSPEAADLVDEGEMRYGFAEYLPYEEVVLFVFWQRVYALTIRGPIQDWSWCYWTLGTPAMSGWRLPVTGEGLVAAPTGHPEFDSVANVTDTSYDVVFTNNGQSGDEYLELWGRPTAGTWSLLKTVAVSTNPTETVAVTDAAVGTEYELRGRYRRGGQYTAGYESADPLDWPASSAGTVTTTAASTPSITDAEWSRTSAIAEQVLLNVTPAHPGVDVEILRGGVVIHTESAPSGPFTFADTGVSPEASNSYTVRHKTVDVTGTSSAATVVWGGPAPKPTIVTIQSTNPNEYDLTWTNGRNDLETEHHDDWTRPSGPVGVFPVTLVVTLPAGQAASIANLTGATGQTLTVGIRHKEQAFGVWDYGEFETDTVLIS